MANYLDEDAQNSDVAEYISEDAMLWAGDDPAEALEFLRSVRPGNFVLESPFDEEIFIYEGNSSAIVDEVNPEESESYIVDITDPADSAYVNSQITVIFYENENGMDSSLEDGAVIRGTELSELDSLTRLANRHLSPN